MASFTLEGLACRGIPSKFRQENILRSSSVGAAVKINQLKPVCSQRPSRQPKTLQETRKKFPSTSQPHARNDKTIPCASSNGRHPTPPAHLAVFVSGGGSNFRTIQEAIREGRINGKVVAVVTDKPECGGSQYAKANGIPVLAYPKSAKFAPHGVSAEDMVAQLQSLGVEFVLLAGYLKLIPQELVQAFPKAVLNIHPALLPAFGGKGCYGMKVHEAVIRSGARVSGPTIHFVDEKYDSGVILAQSTVPVYHTDSPEELQKRVLKEEHRLYPEVVAALCDRRVGFREDGVPYIMEVPASNAAVLI